MPVKNSPASIPLLKGDAYQQSYFTQPPADGSPVSLQHIEVHHRCIWKNVIPAHRLDYYMVFLVMAGEGIHTFGAKEHYIRKNMLCFVGPNVINSWQSEEGEHRGFYCTFSDDFFNLGRENKQFLSEFSFFQIEGNAVIHLSDAQMAYYVSLFTQMHAEYEHCNPYSDDILRSYLHILLNKSYADYHTYACQPDTPNHPGLRLLKAFTALYMRDLAALRAGEIVKLKKVSDYAEAMGVSQNHLNDTIRAVTGQSAGRLIRNQLIKHAAMCLKHSTKTISEIAYRLGFDDSSYFSRFYKNQTGQSPSDFR